MERDPNVQELRQDVVTGDWTILAAGRSKRPDQFYRKEKRKKAPKKGCPFEHPHEEAFMVYPSGASIKNWKLQVIPNKYPILRDHDSLCSEIFSYGPYRYASAIGHHEVVITRDHHKNYPRLSPADALLVLKSFQQRYRVTAQDKCIAYFFALHNWGPSAGASVYHPHYQIIALPVVPPNVYRSLHGSKKYYEKHHICVHCEMIAWEVAHNDRVVFENDEAIAFTPYASRFPFELRVFPKMHFPYFEDTPESVLKGVASILRKTLAALEKYVGDPDYNFYIHTSPIREKGSHAHYHWHIEILSQLTKIASLEIGTGIEVNVVHPGEAAAILRGDKK